MSRASPAGGCRSQISGLLHLKGSGSSVINCCAALQISRGTAAFDVRDRRPARDFPPLLGLILPCLWQPFDCKALQINLLSHQQTAGTDQKNTGRSMGLGRYRVWEFSCNSRWLQSVCVPCGLKATLQNREESAFLFTNLDYFFLFNLTSPEKSHQNAKRAPFPSLSVWMKHFQSRSASANH